MGIRAVAICLALAASTACSRSQRGRPLATTTDDVWLFRIGTGPEQTARVCGGNASDRVVGTLCVQPAPPIRSLDGLYRTLGLGEVARRVPATTTHSLGLSSRIVSALNPRVIVLPDVRDMHRQLTYEQVVVTAFSRGEQVVEIAALDPATYDYNFYLLRFEQACNRTGCTPEDLLTERIERDWTSWTLYADRDLEDTPLDCISCHRPFGAGTHKQLLMHQSLDPWMHWSDFRGGTEGSLCPDRPADGSPGRTVAVAEGLDLLRGVEGNSGRYAAIPVPELHASKSGEILATFLSDVDRLIRLSPYGLAHNYPYGQLDFQTREVLCERFHTGTSPTWDLYRRDARGRGLPVPYYRPDVLDRRRGEEVVTGRQNFLRRHKSENAFDVAASFLAAEAVTAVGFVPDQTDSAPEILRSMCIRCHSGSTDPRLRRARFNAEAIGRVDPITFRSVLRRLRLPRSSPDIMPPLRVGELPGWAVSRIEKYLRDHCTQPGTCS